MALVRETLRRIAELLRENDQLDRAVIAEDAVAGDDQKLDTFLVSNNFWGGSGSIADSGGLMRTGERIERTRRIEDALIAPGVEQIRQRKVNPRTSMWVTAFSKWKAMGI